MENVVYVHVKFKLEKYLWDRGFLKFQWIKVFNIWPLWFREIVEITSFISSAPFFGPSLFNFSTKFNFWNTEAIVCLALEALLLQFKIHLLILSSIMSHLQIKLSTKEVRTSKTIDYFLHALLMFAFGCTLIKAIGPISTKAI